MDYLSEFGSTIIYYISSTYTNTHKTNPLTTLVSSQMHLPAFQNGILFKRSSICTQLPLKQPVFFIHREKGINIRKTMPFWDYSQEHSFFSCIFLPLSSFRFPYVFILTVWTPCHVYLPKKRLEPNTENTFRILHHYKI